MKLDRDDLRTRRGLADVAARAAASVQRSYLDAPVEIEAKGADSRDLVTVVDREAQEAAVSVIREAFPEDPIVGEEDGLDDAELAERLKNCCLIDGLDGTFAFVRRLPFFGTAVGYVADGRPVAGAVFLTMNDEVLSAARGQGASVNGRPLKVSRRTLLEESLLAVMGFPRTDAERKDALRRLDGLLAGSHGVRTFGPPAVDLAYLAAGRIDGFATLTEVGNMGPWGLAAAAVIVEEAGGVITNGDGTTLDPLSKQTLAAASTELLGEIRDVVEPGDE